MGRATRPAAIGKGGQLAEAARGRASAPVRGFAMLEGSQPHCSFNREPGARPG